MVTKLELEVSLTNDTGNILQKLKTVSWQHKTYSLLLEMLQPSPKSLTMYSWAGETAQG